MGKDDLVRNNTPKASQAIANHTSAGGANRAAVPFFAETGSPVLQRMFRVRSSSSSDEEDRQPAKLARSGQKEEATANKDKEEKATETLEDVISTEGKFNEYGITLINNIKATKVAAITEFLGWAAVNQVKVVFQKAKGGGGAGGETFFAAQIDGKSQIIDDPELPFTQWAGITSKTPLQVVIKIYQRESAYGYIDPIHELVVHAMGYKPLVDSIRHMETTRPDTESALLYHFYNEEGDISASGQHDIHGSKLKKEGKGISGYPAYDELVTEQQEKLQQYPKKEKAKLWSKKLGESALHDLKMQSHGGGNLVARRTYEDNSMELLIAWLGTGKGSLASPTQEQSCRSLNLAEIETDWLKILVLYNNYLAVIGQPICPDPQLYSGLGEKKMLLGNTGQTGLAGWLAPGSADFNVSLLNHIAATGDIAGKPVDLKTRKTGTSVSAAQIIGGTKERIQSKEIQALILYRRALAEKKGDRSFDWDQLLVKKQ